MELPTRVRLPSARYMIEEAAKDPPRRSGATFGMPDPPTTKARREEGESSSQILLGEGASG